MVKQVHFLREEDAVEIKLFLQKALEPFLVIVFGSAAKGSIRNDSDIDIAFLSEQNHSAYEVFMIAQELATKLGRDVDLLDLSKASTVMKAQIVNSGRVLHCSNEQRRMDFFMKTLKEYAVLNEQRQPVLAKIAGRSG